MANGLSLVIEQFLFGRANDSSLERFTQDGGVSLDVWVAFAQDITTPKRVLLAPMPGTSCTLMARALHNQIVQYRAFLKQDAARTGVATLDVYVAATVSFRELLHVVLPMTAWWKQARLQEVRVGTLEAQQMLHDAVLARLKGSSSAAFIQGKKTNLELAKQFYDAAPVLGLIGALLIAEDNGGEFPLNIPQVSRESGRRPHFVPWTAEESEQISGRVYRELLGPGHGAAKNAAQKKKLTFKEFLDQNHVIQRVFMDRATSVSDYEALGTIKADAATRVFDISCRNVTWAILDTGIDGRHPAFLDHHSDEKRKPSRVTRTFDFTRVDVIRSYDLTIGKPGSPERKAEIQRVVEELCKVPGRQPTQKFRSLAKRNLKLIAGQLENGLDADWGLIEPLIEIVNPDPDALISDHGTHVAGTLGADWREEKPNSEGHHERKLAGVCPDIRLYDLRVIDGLDSQSVESAVIAALDFIQYLNTRSGTNQLVVSGVNISLSIPHQVRSYGCGATPVCMASDRLSDTGVVVVVAAGNRGWREQDFGFGNFVFCSVADPGNAHKVITVGSTHRLKPHLYGVSFFSSRGPTGDGRVKPDLVAPGEKIQGPVRGDAMAAHDGTSMAAPFVSGAAAMLVSRHKELLGNPTRVKEVLCRTATDLGRERYFQGHGLVDILRALQSI